MKKLSKFLLLSVLLIFLVAGSAMALPTLSLSDGTTTVIIGDETSDDTYSGFGVVSWQGTLGTFFLNVTTGITKPVIGDTAFPRLDLCSVDVSGGAGNLTIMFSEVGFNTSLTSIDSLISEIGGMTDSSVEFNTYIGDSLFDTSTLLSGLGTYGGAFAGTDTSGIGSPLGDYSLTIEAIISHRAWNVSSFNAEISPVSPVHEPATMLLLGAGLIGLAGLGRKKFRKS